MPSGGLAHRALANRNSTPVSCSFNPPQRDGQDGVVHLRPFDVGALPDACMECLLTRFRAQVPEVNTTTSPDPPGRFNTLPGEATGGPPSAESSEDVAPLFRLGR